VAALVIWLVFDHKEPPTPRLGVGISLCVSCLIIDSDLIPGNHKVDGSDNFPLHRENDLPTLPIAK
jgi:hypothetical protein